MRIRAAIPDDAPRIEAIWSPQIRDTVVTFNALPKSAAEIAAMIAARPCFLVLEGAGGVIGFASYDQFRGGVGYAHTMEHTIILAPAATGQGHGRRLMVDVLDHATAAGVHSMWAGVSGENAGAVVFHERLGFEHIAVLPEVGRKFDRWMDLILMQKRL